MSELENVQIPPTVGEYWAVVITPNFSADISLVNAQDPAGLADQLGLLSNQLDRHLGTFAFAFKGVRLDTELPAARLVLPDGSSLPIRSPVPDNWRPGMIALPLPPVREEAPEESTQDEEDDDDF